MVVTEKEEEEPEPCGLSRSSVEPTLLDHHLVKVLVIGDGDEGIEIFVGELVSQACEGQDEDEDCGSTACIDAKFNNIESMIYQRLEFLNIRVGTMGMNFPTFNHSIVDASCHATHIRNWTMEVWVPLKTYCKLKHLLIQRDQEWPLMTNFPHKIITVGTFTGCEAHKRSSQHIRENWEIPRGWSPSPYQQTRRCKFYTH
ncbi:hypothetical protein Pyn_38694 [Prunus yedoensis var. nudiflora]|uniref:Uncharacterized protein n=1 Tax=Prunus yedoensis var. nudiflora TaxID=2094558 RepID=A0A314YVJ7_PRUYE|nr:hypothetical protein Pyn_38694 [Prunus yedoensis var. nudiflora]